MRPSAFGFALELAHLIHASGESLQKIPGQAVATAVSEDQPFLLEFPDQNGN
jgi:hypothetical protein